MMYDEKGKYNGVNFRSANESTAYNLLSQKKSSRKNKSQVCLGYTECNEKKLYELLMLDDQT